MRVIMEIESELVQLLPYRKPSKRKLSEYIDLMNNGVIFPPVHIWIHNGKLQFNDGIHRVMASKMTNKPLTVKLHKMFVDSLKEFKTND